MKNSKVKHYPEQVGAYAVKVKNGAGWKAYSVARFHISVGQEYHEDEKFKATMGWAKHRFDKVIICLNDTLQRHNYIYEGMSEQEAYFKSEARGREWLERNLKFLRVLPNYEIRRWEEWRQSPYFKIKIAAFNKSYQSNYTTKVAIHEEISNFWERKKSKENILNDTNFDIFEAHSKNYLLEECAVFSLMFDREEAVDVYPGSTLLPCNLLRPESVLGARGFTRIDFSKRNQNKDQKQNLLTRFLKNKT